MDYTLKLIPADPSPSSWTEPVTVAEVKAHCRIDTDDDDTLIEGLIAAARRGIEKKIHRLIGVQTWEYSLGWWPCGSDLAIPLVPLQSVERVAYTDKDYLETVLLDLSASPSSSSAVFGVHGMGLEYRPGFLRLKLDQVWPTTVQLAPGYPIVIQVTAGIPIGVDFPAPIKQAILMMVAHFYEHREAVSSEGVGEVPMAVEWLLDGEINTVYV